MNYHNTILKIWCYKLQQFLHNETLAEFKPFEKIGWIVINPHGSVALMGANNRIGNLIEDRKRPWGYGNGFIITIKKELYEN